MTFGHIELFCHNPQGCAEWWMRTFNGVLVADQGLFQWVEIGGQELLMRPGEPNAGAAYRQSSQAMVLYVDDLEAETARLRDMEVEFAHGDNYDCLTLTDSEGHWIQVTSKG